MSPAALATNDPYQRLLGAVDQLAATRAAYLADEAPYADLRAAYDAVAQARDEAGVDLTLTCLESRNMTALKYTHDRRPVHPAGSELPTGASGWTRCRLGSASYATWIDTADVQRAKTDLATITAEARELRRKSQAIIAIAVMGGHAYESERLCDMRTQWVNLAMAAAWPLLEVV